MKRAATRARPRVLASDISSPVDIPIALVGITLKGPFPDPAKDRVMGLGCATTTTNFAAYIQTCYKALRCIAEGIAKVCVIAMSNCR